MNLQEACVKNQRFDEENPLHFVNINLFPSPQSVDHSLGKSFDLFPYFPVTSRKPSQRKLQSTKYS